MPFSRKAPSNNMFHNLSKERFRNKVNLFNDVFYNLGLVFLGGIEFVYRL